LSRVFTAISDRLANIIYSILDAKENFILTGTWYREKPDFAPKTPGNRGRRYL